MKHSSRKLQEIQREINSLRDRIAEEKEDRVTDEQLVAGLGSLLGEPLNLFDTLSADKQARIYQILFRGVRIDCRGRGTGRQWRLFEYAPKLGGEPVRVLDSVAIRPAKSGRSALGSMMRARSYSKVRLPR